MEMPIPIFCGDKVYREIEIKKPTPAVIADTKKVSDEGNTYYAMQTYISGSVESYTAEDGTVITDRNQVRQITASMPFRSADWVSIQIALKLDAEDGIEGVYNCPRCGKQVIAEKNERLGIDTRDFVSDLEVRKMETPQNEVQMELKEPVEMDIGDVKDLVKTLKFRHPVLSDCNRAYSMVGVKDQVRFTLFMFNEALVQINGKEASKQFKSRYGMMLFEKMDIKKDINQITAALTQYGMDTDVRKICPECGKEWRATVNTANFFVSGLQ